MAVPLIQLLINLKTFLKGYKYFEIQPAVTTVALCFVIQEFRIIVGGLGHTSPMT